MDVLLVCILRIIIYIIIISFWVVTIIFIKDIYSHKKIIISILLVFVSFGLTYFTLFYGAVQNAYIDYPFLCESYETIKTNIIDNGEELCGVNNINYYCLDVFSDEITYSISFFEDYRKLEEKPVCSDSMISGTFDGIHYNASPLIAQREQRLAFSFNGGYSGEIILIKDYEVITIDYTIGKRKWYDILFVSKAPCIDIAKTIVRALDQSGVASMIDN